MHPSGLGLHPVQVLAGFFGPLIFAGSAPDENDNGILVLLNTVFYRVCP